MKAVRKEELVNIPGKTPANARLIVGMECPPVNSGRRQGLLLSSFLILSVQDFSGGSNRIKKKRLPEKTLLLDHIILQIEKKPARPSM